MKDQLRQWLRHEQYEPVVELAGRKKRVLSWLTALTYDPDPLLSWRAITAMGLAAGRIAAADPEYVRVHLLRLLWLLNDESGGIGWRAPEAIAEMIRARPEFFPQFLPIVATLLDMEPEDVKPFKPGMLWAIGRLAAQIKETTLPLALPWILPCLDDSQPQTRGLAAWCLGQLGAAGELTAHPALLADDSPVEIFLDGCLIHTRVADLVHEALTSPP